QGAPETGLGNATYLAAIQHLDDSIGRLLETIERSGQLEKTVVVFLADNGGVDTKFNHREIDGSPFDPSHPLTVQAQEFDSAPFRGGKGSMYEGGIRVPCLVRWPGVIASGSVCDTPIHVVDWLPTLLDAAGIDAAEEDGLSLLPAFRGETLPERSLYWYLPLYDLRWGATPCAIIRRGDWKLIEFFGDRFDSNNRYVREEHVELYELPSDIGETNNLADVHPKQRDRLRNDLRRWLESFGMKLPRSNPHYDTSRAFEETREKPPHLLGSR
ncbi:MAG: sulfatase-like hydrolase/transferase, partial [Planctomycetota bacterium]